MCERVRRLIGRGLEEDRALRPCLFEASATPRPPERRSSAAGQGGAATTIDVAQLAQLRALLSYPVAFAHPAVCLSIVRIAFALLFESESPVMWYVVSAHGRRTLVPRQWKE